MRNLFEMTLGEVMTDFHNGLLTEQQADQYIAEWNKTPRFTEAYRVNHKIYQRTKE